MAGAGTVFQPSPIPLTCLPCQPLAARMVRLPRGRAGELKARRERFAESGWKLLTYSASVGLALCLLSSQGWAADSARWWRGWPVGQHHPPLLLLLYRAQLGFYLAGLWMLAAWETRRKDHAVMVGQGRAGGLR